jgi:hypothetical protein
MSYAEFSSFIISLDLTASEILILSPYKAQTFKKYLMGFKIFPYVYVMYFSPLFL